MYFTVAAKRGGLQSPWTSYACTTTPANPWCPSSDATHPTCSSIGAFQESCDFNAGCSGPVNDYGTLPSDDFDNVLVVEAAAAYEGLGFLSPLAQSFFEHYADNTGTDLTFDASIPYSGSVGFSQKVDGTVNEWLERVHNAASTFDSGWLDFPAKNTPGDTDIWNDDWKYALGHCFYRVVGTRQGDGSWTVHLQLTSYYQFRIGRDFPASFPVVFGADLRRLEKIGWMKNFRSIRQRDAVL
jgi:hypothetical protein